MLYTLRFEALWSVCLQLVMRAVAEGFRIRPFTSAKVNRARFIGSKGYRVEAGCYMRAVAEWLIFALSTGAPVVGFSGFYLNLVGANFAHLWNHLIFFLGYYLLLASAFAAISNAT